MTSPVLQWQIVTPDPERVLKFYRDLFGWSVSSANALGYREVDTGEGGTRGGVWPAPAGTPGMVQLFVGVPDVEKAVEQAIGLGATIIVPPSVLPDGDVMAIISDPSGLPLGLMRHQTGQQSR